MSGDDERRLTAVLVDDEDLARAVLNEFLLAHPEVSVVAECANGFDAVKAVNELKPDLLFLDVQMPKLDGFEVLELLEHAPAVVFVTAYDQYAVRAFDAQAVDYLLKPFDRARFEKALARAKKRVGAGESVRRALEEARPSDRAAARVVVKDGTKVTVLPVEAIDFVKAEDDYVLIRSGGRGHLKQETLAHLSDRLPKDRFLRVHRSFLLNLDRLERLEEGEGGGQVAVLKDGARLPVSREGARRLRAVLDGS